MIRRHYQDGDELEELPELPEGELTDDEIDWRYSDWRRAVERWRRSH
jgi:hypothetical protein